MLSFWVRNFVYWRQKPPRPSDLPG